MKSFIVLAPLFFFGVVLSATPDIGLHKYILSIPENNMIKCLKESDLEAEKDKVLTDETSVDLQKLSCLLACTSRESGVLVNGELKLDIIEKILSKVLTKEDKPDKIIELVKSCIPEGANEKNDCDNIRKVIQCEYRKAPEMGF